MSNWNIGQQEISGGNVQQGDHNHQDNRGMDPEDVRKAQVLIAELLEGLRAEQRAGNLSNQSMVDEAEVIEGELVIAEQEGRLPDVSVMRRAWHQMKAAVTPATVAVAGSATADLVTQFGQLIGS